MKCIIISPEPEVKEAIEKIISQNKLLQVLKSAASVDEAKECLLSSKPDVVFIHIEKPSNPELDILNNLPHGKPDKVFLSFKSERAKDAFDQGGKAFIQLPLTAPALLRTLGRLMKPDTIGRHPVKNNSPDNALFIKTNKTVTKLNLKDIQYVEALADYVNIYTLKHRYTIHSTMKGLLGKLPENAFIRVHKSYIVSIDKISRIDNNAVFVDGKSIPLSRPFKKLLLQRIDLLH